ncbi:hypothetical protein A3B19_00270 [Candidatus Giovannonibacteria bacterium RIFCSPLOWO2_01_FULL_46_32]|uniref:Uncharacterized protein n=1 Tax=Candidatus Giovannonibacteria bacterium RIFCSPLOWO2_01_FULL_46_32 TaxID=1798353 RepID=A0A1F5XGR3_9BACT|nr:MAG: hypothetical protein A3B19_00270 [Candidatus Giovannonibacteria bacterium RIFCSPLOWO2_01_FULL_46_32]
MKRILTGFCALVLAALGPTFYVSFSVNVWRMDVYSAGKPSEMLVWGFIAAVIAATILVSSGYYSESRCKLIAFFDVWFSCVITIGLGTAVSWLLFLDISHTQSTFPFWMMVFLLSLLAAIASVALAQFDLARAFPASGEKRADADEPLPKEGFVKMKG